jgi:hypothetical protein
MTDQLSDLLHRSADELPIYVRSAGGIKRAAETRQRRRRWAAAAATAAGVALAVGAGAVLGAGGSTLNPPPAHETLSPSELTYRGLLSADQLPTLAPFTGWSGAHPVDPAAIPLCLDTLGTPVAASYRQFDTAQPGTVGYQAVLDLGSPSAAAAAGGPAIKTAQRLLECAALDSYGDGIDSWGSSNPSIYLPWPGPSGHVTVLARTHAGSFVSLLWLSGPGTHRLTEDGVRQQLLLQPLSNALSSNLYEGTADVLTDVPVGALEAAMLRPGDVPFGGPAPLVVDAAMEPNQALRLSTCDSAALPQGVAMRNVTFLADQDGNGSVYDAGDAETAGQRVYVTGSPQDAQSLLGQLAQDVRDCPKAATRGERVVQQSDLDVTGLGDEATGWSDRMEFTSGPLRGQTDNLYVLIARVGSVVTEIVRRQPTETDPGPQAAAAFASHGVQRLLDNLPATVTGQTP